MCISRTIGRKSESVPQFYRMQKTTSENGSLIFFTIEIRKIFMPVNDSHYIETKTFFKISCCQIEYYWKLSLKIWNKNEVDWCTKAKADKVPLHINSLSVEEENEFKYLGPTPTTNNFCTLCFLLNVQQHVAYVIKQAL